MPAIESSDGPAAQTAARRLPGAAIVAMLRAAGCVFAEDEAALLSTEFVDPTRRAAAVARRIAGEPLEQILGWAEFQGLRIVVERGVFVPRQRTGVLVAQALAILNASGRVAPVVVDLCCGSGAIAAAVTARRPDAEVHAVDIDEAAVRCAQRNLAAGAVHHGDLFAALPVALAGRIDVLVVNAPYVPTAQVALLPREAREHEPRLALDGGPDGLDLHRRIIGSAAGWLAPGGHLLIESSEQQADVSAGLMRAAGLTTRLAHDDEIDGTAVVGRRPSRLVAPTRARSDVATATE